jgi:tRNA(Ile)-lysidine synthase
VSDLPRQVAARLEDHQLVPKDRRLLVAVSGGLDSMVLLHVLAGLRRPRLDLVVAHANHQLRGEESDVDAAFVEACCRKLGIPCHVGLLQVRDALSRSQESLEMVARRLRHRFLAATATQEGIQTLATAHHADDQAELLLIRLLRGAGSEGLAGMTWQGPSPVSPNLTLVRPLLRSTREDLLRFAKEKVIVFREDSSNSDRSILRNRIRHELLPLLEREFNPGIRGVIGRTAELLGDEAEHLAAEATQWRGNPEPTPFASLSPALQRWVLRQELWNLGHDAGFDHLERLRIGKSATLALGLNLKRRSSGSLTLRETAGDFSAGRTKISLARSGTQMLGEVLLEWRRTPRPKRDAQLPSLPGWECLDAKSVGVWVVFRHWRPGDRFQMLGRKQPSKLQDVFVNRKVPASLRRRLVIGETSAGEIFWVEGLPPGEAFKVTPATGSILTIQARRGSA